MAKKYVRSIQFTESGEVYYIRDGQTKDRVDNLAQVASTGSYKDLDDKLVAGAGVNIDENNVITTTNSFIYEQGIAADTWVINHNLNKIPAVLVLDSANNIIETAVEYPTLDTCVVKLKNSFKGKAYLT